MGELSPVCHTALVKFRTYVLDLECLSKLGPACDPSERKRYFRAWGPLTNASVAVAVCQKYCAPLVLLGALWHSNTMVGASCREHSDGQCRGIVSGAPVPIRASSVTGSAARRLTTGRAPSTAISAASTIAWWVNSSLGLPRVWPRAARSAETRRRLACVVPA